MYRVGLIGAGTMGRTHADSYARMPGVELAGIFDIRPEAAKKLIDDLKLKNCKAADSADALFNDQDIDVISICVPTPWHKENVTKAAQAGKHIFCEKPMARTSADAKEMLEVCEKAGVRLMIGHVLRFFPEYTRAKQAVASGAVGSPAMVRTTRAGGFPRAWNDWYNKFEWSGGVTLDLVIHDIDWLCWTFGKPVRVFAKGLIEKNMDAVDYALITIRFESGVIAHVEGSWAYPGSFTTKFEIAGSKGLIDYQSPAAAPIRVTLKQTSQGSGGVAVPESPLAESPYYIEDRHFFESLRQGSEFMVTPQDGLTAVRVACAALESIKTGMPVEL